MQNWVLKFYFGDKTLQLGRIVAPQRIRVDCTEWSVCDKKVVTVQLAKNVDRSKDKDKVCDDKKVTLQAFKMHRMLALSALTPLSCPLIADSIT